MKGRDGRRRRPHHERRQGVAVGAPVSQENAPGGTNGSEPFGNSDGAGVAVTPMPGVGERGAPPISRTRVTRLGRAVSAGGMLADATPRELSSATATVSSRLETIPSAPRTTQRRAAGLVGPLG